MEVLIVILLMCFTDLSYTAEWSYKYETQWPGICRVGELQSPINIMTRDAVLDFHEAHIRGPLGFRGYGDVRVTGINNGHTLKWTNVPDAPAPVMSGGPLRGNYTFLQFHLHWLSEHAIDGMKYPLEIHMVHIKTGLTVEEAVLRPDGLAVIGVLCMVHSGGSSEYALEEIMPDVPDLLEPSEKQTEAKTIDMTRIFSPDPQSYYTYHGSLTTPNCQEAVTWIVMDKPLMISDAQVHAELEPHLQDPADELIQYIPRLLKPGKRINKVLLNMTKLMNPDLEKYYTYSGSLTTLECKEAVIWIIFERPIFITDLEYNVFRKASLEKYNFRLQQKIRRHVIFTPPQGSLVNKFIHFFKNVTRFPSNFNTRLKWVDTTGKLNWQPTIYSKMDLDDLTVLKQSRTSARIAINPQEGKAT